MYILILMFAITNIPDISDILLNPVQILTHHPFLLVAMAAEYDISLLAFSHVREAVS